jgi:hypothetical protein
MQCPQCRAENDSGLRFCESCGATLARLCPSCGHELKPQAKFCGQCGAELRGSGVGDRVSVADTPHPLPDTLPQGERRQLTVLFCDLVGSTPLSQQLDAEEWRDLIAQYQQAASGAVGRFGGHVAKNLGDGLLIYFGWPTAREDDPERAVRAGLAIVEAVRALKNPPVSPFFKGGEEPVPPFEKGGLERRQ